MSTSTTNYSFVKPAASEKYSRALLNNNFDLIDSAIKTATEKIKHVEILRANQVDHPAGTLWGPGNLFGQIDPTPSFNYSDWAASGANDSIKLSAGVYFIDWKIVNNTGANVSLWHSICLDGSNGTTANVTTVGRSITTAVPANDPFFTWGHIVIPTTPTDVFFKFSSGTAGATISHRIKITKLN